MPRATPLIPLIKWVLLCLSFITLPALGHESAPQSAPEECEEALVPKFKTINEIKSYLNEHMLFGPEVTFSSEALKQTNGSRYFRVNSGAPPVTHFDAPDWDTIKAHIQTHVPAYPETALNDALRFLQTVFDVTKITIHLSPAPVAIPIRDDSDDYMEHDGVKLHQQNVLFLLQIKNHRNSWVSVTLEPTCLEVNFPPQKYQDIGPTWESIFEKALDAGFYGYDSFASSGGGGHIHVGFDTVASNLFLSRPSLLADFLLFPLMGNGILPMLCAQNDHGRCGNVRTPMDIYARTGDPVTDSENVLKKVAELDRYLRETPYLSPQQVEFVVLLKEIFLHEHHSYVSLKRFTLEDNPRIELRHFRASNSVKDLSAAIAYIYHTAVLSLANKVRYDIKTLHKASERIFQTHRLQFESFLSILSVTGLSDEHKQQLLHFGGDTLPQQLTIRTQGPGLRRTKGTLEISGSDRPFHHTIRIPLSVEVANKLADVQVGTSSMPARFIEQDLINKDTPHPELMLFIDYINPFQESKVLIRLSDAVDTPLDSFTILYKPLVPRPTNATDFAITVRRTTTDDTNTFMAAHATATQATYQQTTDQQTTDNSARTISVKKIDNSYTDAPHAFQLYNQDDTFAYPIGLQNFGIHWTETATTYELLIPNSIIPRLFNPGHTLYLVNANGDAIVKPIYFLTPEEITANAEAATAADGEQ